MRYLRSILRGLPCFLFFGGWLIALGESPEPWRPIAPGLGVGTVLGMLALHPIRQALVEGKEHWSMRTVPGGVWFVIALGLLGGVAGMVVWSKNRVLAVDLGLATVSPPVAAFSVIGLWVCREERRRGRQIWMDRSGLKVREPD